MRNLILILLLTLFLLPVAHAAEHRLGVGIHYWQSMNDFDLEDDYDSDGASLMLTYQARGEYTAWELDLEILPENYGGSPDPAYAPQLYLLLGSGLYIGPGIGINYIDGSFDDTFFAFKGGIDFNLVSNLYLDINANYRFQDFSEFGELEKEVSGDTVTLGAALRYKF